jgi:hypothetical protein
MDPAEKIAGTDLVLWYVPQLENSDVPGEEYCWVNTNIVNGEPEFIVSPCYAGPMFIPTTAAGE